MSTDDVSDYYERGRHGPHVAAMTIQAQTAMAVQAASEILRVLVEGLPPTVNVLD